jgi:hypothetical protein
MFELVQWKKDLFWDSYLLVSSYPGLSLNVDLCCYCVENCFREREQDLWDVIEQYKQLAEQNQSVEQQKHNVERELQ